MICRLWRGCTSPQNADAYARIARGRVIPEIEAMESKASATSIYCGAPAAKRWSSSPSCGSATSPPCGASPARTTRVAMFRSEARAVLARFDERAAHYDVLDRRPQPV